jgi:hypothetical protein
MREQEKLVWDQAIRAEKQGQEHAQERADQTEE